MKTKTRRRPGEAPKKPVKTKSSPRKRPAPKAERPAHPVAEVVYTPAKPFQRNRFLLRLGTVAAVVLALIFGLSLFFKVETVAVSGNEKYTAWDVMEASGIRQGDNLLTLSKAKSAGLIRTKLSYVDQVRIGIKLPGTVNIEIKELDVVYAMGDSAGGWWYVTSDGRIVEKTNLAGANSTTKVEGVTLESPVVGSPAQAFQPQATETLPSGETAPPVVYTEAQKLATALEILRALEEHSLLGEVISVDVTDPGAMTMEYGDRFLVELGDSSRLSYKVSCVATAVKTLRDYDRGTLDVSFTLKPAEIVYTPGTD